MLFFFSLRFAIAVVVITIRATFLCVRLCVQAFIQCVCAVGRPQESERRSIKH